MINADKCLEFLKDTKDIKVPAGRFLDDLPDALRAKPQGLKASLFTLAEFIDQHQAMESTAANKELLARMRGEDGLDISSLMSDVAIAKAMGEDTAAPLAKLQSALKIGFDKKDVFEEIFRVIKTIALENSITFKDAMDQKKGNDSGKSLDPGDKANHGTWRESIESDREKNIPNKDITESAKDENDKGIDDKAISKSAEDGNKFVPEPDDYERLEASNADMDHFAALQNNSREIRQYADFASDLLTKYFKMGKSKGQAPD